MSGAITLPRLVWTPTRAKGSRHGAKVRLVVVHRWGVRYTDPAGEALSYRGVIREFENPDNGASAHVVYPGSAVAHGGEAAQMVAWADKAWTEAFYNPTSDEIESADAIWLAGRAGKVLDEHGFAVLARMVAKRLLDRGLPPVWVHGDTLLHGPGGFCRHADLGELGGGHTQCPTTDLELWHRFVGAVRFEYHRGAFKRTWGR